LGAEVFSGLVLEALFFFCVAMGITLNSCPVQSIQMIQAV